MATIGAALDSFAASGITYVHTGEINQTIDQARALFATQLTRACPRLRGTPCASAIEPPPPPPPFSSSVPVIVRRLGPRAVAVFAQAPGHALFTATMDQCQRLDDGCVVPI
jgi:hypothetical protein